MLQRLGRTFKYYFLTLLRMQNSDHRIALGFAAGFFPCWFPTMGIDIIIAIALSRLVCGNLAAAVIAASAGSVLWPLLFYMNYKIGLFISKLFASAAPVSFRDVIHSPVPGRNYSVLADYLNKLGDLGVNFLIGSLVNSVVSIFVVYATFRFLLSRYRKPMLHKIKLGVKHRRKQCERSKSA
ncbi:DUF2062 domain-containing protein [Paenibacillus sp. DMB20]|uniref:DUF2062 domain-containing protein n=1 Tax=Paenibacillus sp. DMB20 TaxID=1642570 RepID=UPI000627B845|nr:DUF2062 domain-containing protein [Paenibacillus sp. DMB20]KKO53663.1 hypothetical protein XI25_11755 [Paenibacillus sp. DMB20]